MILWLTFQFGEFYNQGSSGFLIDLLITLIGTGLGFFFSWLIFYQSLKEDRRREHRAEIEEKEKEEEKKRIAKEVLFTYFVSLLKRVKKLINGQIAGYKKLEKELQADPYNFHLLKIVNPGDLNRLMRLDHERLFNSYLEHFGRDKQPIFEKLFSELDRVEALHKESVSTYQQFYTNYYKILDQYKTLAEEALSTSAIMVNDIRVKTPGYEINELYNFLNKSIVSFYEAAPDPITINYLQKQFIEPVQQNMVKKFMHSDRGVTIAEQCRKATWTYIGIEKYSITTSEEFKEFQEELTNALKRIEELTVNLPGISESETPVSAAQTAS